MIKLVNIALQFKKHNYRESEPALETERRPVRNADESLSKRCTPWWWSEKHRTRSSPTMHTLHSSRCKHCLRVSHFDMRRLVPREMQIECESIHTVESIHQITKTVDSSYSLIFFFLISFRCTSRSSFKSNCSYTFCIIALRLPTTFFVNCNLTSFTTPPSNQFSHFRSKLPSLDRPLEKDRTGLLG